MKTATKKREGEVEVPTRDTVDDEERHRWAHQVNHCLPYRQPSAIVLQTTAPLNVFLDLHSGFFFPEILAVPGISIFRKLFFILEFQFLEYIFKFQFPEYIFSFRNFNFRNTTFVFRKLNFWKKCKIEKQV